ncbi:hypothetical protein Emag_006935 [Eimeria magna]
MTVSTQLSQAPHVDVGEALPAANNSVQTREASNAPPSSFLSPDALDAHQELASPSCNRRLRFRGGPGCKLVLGAIASAAAIAVLISLCATAYLRTPALQLAGRRLSGRGLPKSTTGLGACGATSGDYPGDNTQASGGGEELEPPPQKKARLKDGGPDADTEAGSQPQTSGSRHEVSPSAAAAAAATNLRAQSALERVKSPAEFVAAQALISLGDEQHLAPLEQRAPGPALQDQAQSSLASQQQAQPFPVSQQQAVSAPWPPHVPIPPPYDIIRLPHVPSLSPVDIARLPHVPGPSPVDIARLPHVPILPPAAVARFPHAPIPPHVAIPTATTSTVSSANSSVSSFPAGVEGPHPRGASVQPAPFPQVSSFYVPPCEDVAPRFSDARLALLSSSGEMDIIDPLSDWEPPFSGEGGSQHPFLEHPFSRLPRVEGGDPSKFSSFVDPGLAVSLEATPHVQAPLLRTMASLLEKEVLSRSQLQQLGIITQHVLSHLALNERRPLQECAAFAVESLGHRFLLLDMAVSALQLLGVPCSGQWWEQMVSNIPDDYVRPPRRRNVGQTFNVKLLTRLTPAVRMLKSGRRPPPEVLVQIKRCLFCSLHSPIRFLKHAWDEWREADKRFYQQFEGTPGQRDSPQPGPSHQSGS